MTRWNARIISQETGIGTDPTIIVQASTASNAAESIADTIRNMADAVRGLSPRLMVWPHGADEDDGVVYVVEGRPVIEWVARAET